MRAVVLTLAALFLASSAQAGGKKKPVDPAPAPAAREGKVTLELVEIPRAAIEVPTTDRDAERVYDFSPGFTAQLTHDLTTAGNAIILQKTQTAKAAELRRANALALPGEEPVWDGLPPPAAARMKIVVESMTFQTGSGGDRMSYGMDEHLSGDFSSLDLQKANEFPMRETTFNPNWFDRTFDYEGDWNTGSRAGLDLGQGFRLDAVFAFLQVKYASYRSDIRLRLTLDSEVSPGVARTHVIQVKGKGYYFDVAGGYLQFAGSIALARRDALGKAVGRAFDGSLGTIRGLLASIPRAASVHAVGADGVIYLNTGMEAGIPVGTTYVAKDDPTASLTITRAVKSGALARLATGSSSVVRPGSIWVEGTPSTPPTRALAQSFSLPLPVLDSIELPDERLPGTDLGIKQSKWKAFLKSIIGLPLLPYRIWRYFQYDQGLKGWDDLENQNELDRDLAREGDSKSQAKQAADEEFSADALGSSEAKDEERSADKVSRLGVAASLDSEPIVAVIDSGVDYNHSAVHSRVWLNPEAVTDSRARTDRYGWDFISGDARPYDDHFHGTAIAGRLLQVAPRARVMPLKVFNPWGLTSSAAIESAFRYAVDHGAQVILCGWATMRPSRAIEAGVRYAAMHGVIVVAAAGDRGDDIKTAPEYPAALSEAYDNVISVAALSQSGDILRRFGFFSNYAPTRVQVAAMGENLNVPSPRGQWRSLSGTGLAAAAVAGWLVSDGQRAWMSADAESRGRAAREIVRLGTRAVPALESYVSEGRVLSP